MDITIKPSANQTEISTSKGPLVLSSEDVIALMENARGQGIEIRVEFQARGYKLDNSIMEKALELAGLESFQAAEQYSKGYVEF